MNTNRNSGLHKFETGVIDHVAANNERSANFRPAGEDEILRMMNGEK